jgi:hypothetical protein
MTPIEVIDTVAIIAVGTFAIVGVIVMIPLFRLIMRGRQLMEKLSESIIPTVAKLNSTVSNLNSEISSISDLTQSVSSIVEQLEKLIRLARILITNPLIKLISAGVGLADGIKKSAEKDGKTKESKKKAKK